MLLGNVSTEIVAKRLVLKLQFSMVDSDKQSCYVTVAIHKQYVLCTDTVVYSMIYRKKRFQK